MPARERPCLEHVQRCPGLLVAFSLSLVSFKQGATNQKPSLELLRHPAPTPAPAQANPEAQYPREYLPSRHGYT